MSSSALQGLLANDANVNGTTTYSTTYPPHTSRTGSRLTEWRRQPAQISPHHLQLRLGMALACWVCVSLWGSFSTACGRGLARLWLTALINSQTRTRSNLYGLSKKGNNNLLCWRLIVYLEDELVAFAAEVGNQRGNLRYFSWKSGYLLISWPESECKSSTVFLCLFNSVLLRHRSCVLSSK